MLNTIEVWFIGEKPEYVTDIEVVTLPSGKLALAMNEENIRTLFTLLEQHTDGVADVEDHREEQARD